MNSQTGTRDFPTVVQRFFCDYLMNQRNASPRTIAAYRDTFRLLLRELQIQRGKSASELEFPDLDAPAVLAFLRSSREIAAIASALATRDSRRFVRLRITLPPRKPRSLLAPDRSV